MPSPPTTFMAPLLPPKPAGLSWREFLITQMQIGMEIEQALMVQYLYAAYSLGGPGAATHAPEVRRWRDELLTIAREEMGHLATVQNVILLLGGPVNFERHQHPWSSPYYPFEFNLEPFSLESLARYVYAEMPLTMKDAEDEAVGRKVLKLVGKDVTPTVGELYRSIINLLKNEAEIPDALFQVGSHRRQVTWDEMGRGYRPDNLRPYASETNAPPPDDRRALVIVGQVVTRTDALIALRSIAGQGEAEHLKIGDQREPSHFDRFSRIFRAYERILESSPGWSPSRPVPRNPVADQANQAPHGSTPITNRGSQAWARLFNFRYRMLLTLLTFLYRIPRDPEAPTSPQRAQVLARLFGEMYHLKTIAGILVRLPLGDPSDEERAGPPFQLPYSLALSESDADVWRQQVDLLESCAELVRLLLERPAPDSPPEAARYLAALVETDRDARAWIEKVLVGLAPGRRIRP